MKNCDFFISFEFHVSNEKAHFNDLIQMSQMCLSIDLKETQAVLNYKL